MRTCTCTHIGLHAAYVYCYCIVSCKLGILIRTQTAALCCCFLKRVSTASTPFPVTQRKGAEINPINPWMTSPDKFYLGRGIMRFFQKQSSLLSLSGAYRNLLMQAEYNKRGRKQTRGGLSYIVDTLTMALT